MITKDFADKLIENLRVAAYRVGYVEATGSPFANRNQIDGELAQAIRDLREVLTVPSPHSEDFPDMRDQFAMAALPEMLKGDSISVETAAQISGVTVAEYTWRKHFPKVAAILAYEQADAMMKAREVKA